MKKGDALLQRVRDSRRASARGPMGRVAEDPPRASPAQPATAATTAPLSAPTTGLLHLSSAAAALSHMHLSRVTSGDAHGEAISPPLAPRSSDSASEMQSHADAMLPAGWQRVTHDSGLSCFAHDALGLVSWTRPYSLQSVDGPDAFWRLVKSHVPPLSIFERAKREAVESNGNSGKAATASDSIAPNKPSKKRDVDAANAPSILMESTPGEDDQGLPRVLINGVKMERPDGKSIHAFLREFVIAAWKAQPQYVFCKNEEDSDNPMSCSIRIHDKQFAAVARSTRMLAKDAAAESFLEEYLPGYWSQVKQEREAAKPPPLPPVKPTESKNAAEHSAMMTMDEFKTLAIADPRVVQACMDLGVKTPAQVLQEYQNRNRGISINYNTVPVDRDGLKLFKTVVTSGSAAAEGEATTKKIAKQLGAQKLLAMLHEHRVETYQEVADLYRSHHKNAGSTFTESSQAVIPHAKRRATASPAATPFSSSSGYAAQQGAPQPSEWGHGHPGYASGPPPTYAPPHPHSHPHFHQHPHHPVEAWPPNASSESVRPTSPFVAAATCGVYNGNAYYGRPDEWSYRQAPLATAPYGPYAEYSAPTKPFQADGTPAMLPYPTPTMTYAPRDPRLAQAKNHASRQLGNPQ